MEQYQNYEYKGIKLFKHFELNNERLGYQTYKERKIRKVRASTQAKLIQWVDNNLIVNIKQKIDSIERWDKQNREAFNNLNMGDIVYWIEGYNCTLYQFAKIIKKTDTTIICQKYEYRSMDCITKLRDLLLTTETLTLSYKRAALYKEYKAENEAKGYYENNSD